MCILAHVCHRDWSLSFPLILAKHKKIKIDFCQVEQIEKLEYYRALRNIIINELF